MDRVLVEELRLIQEDLAMGEQLRLRLRLW